MDLVDTHCHIHSANFPLDKIQVMKEAKAAGVNRLICVGTSLEDSEQAIDFAKSHTNVWASAGVHPHDADEFVNNKQLQTKFKEILNKSSISAIGEIGLDYYKNYSAKEQQKKALKLQIEAGLGLGLPFIFHVRDAWDDFWQIYDSYDNLSGVVHSFSASPQQLEQVLKRDLYVGLNGIMTFTKDEQQLAAAKLVPLDKLLLETDAPYLTPAPHRGKTCEPKHVLTIVEFLAKLRGEPLERLANATTINAVAVFGL